ncbi:DUF4267 domain-containing protein [Microvirga massiliensis]|uniref:DUF4267 domain-containing protein n=1 Tax=Microvirga massiliensis TaxID=1033741 RepID=UPI00062B8F49|nr:DUF4267 domain-containing protein [Microvirga massiliensis]
MRDASEEQIDRLPIAEFRTWIVLGLALVFVLIGALFILVPIAGAALFGIPAPEGIGQSYLRAIGFRDLALGLYIAGLTLFATRSAVVIVLAVTVLIPLCDIVLVAIARGLSSPGHLLLHAGSALCFAALAIWVARAET